jgi:outer membrane protein insertion porin family
VLSTVDPYFTIDGISRGIDIYYRTSRPINSQGEEYELVTPGFAIRFGVPFSEYDTVFFGIGAERTEIKGATQLPNSYFLYREQFGDTSNSLPLTIGWTRDNRDSALVPTAGRYMRVNLDYAPLGDAKYFAPTCRASSTSRSPARSRSASTPRSATARARRPPYPIFKNFYGGGLGTVRGFEQGSLGPVDVTGAFIGGNRRFNLNNELYLPVPGAGADRTLRLFVYADAGNVWGENEKSPSTACAPRPDWA